MPATISDNSTSQVDAERRLAAIVLCGGNSRRMGRPKYRLSIGEETLLQRICRIVTRVASPVVIVGAADQDLSDAPRNCFVVRDSVAGHGPLQALADGLAALRTETTGFRVNEQCGVFVCSCDLPLLTTAVIEFLRDQLRVGDDAVVIRDAANSHPLCAVYRFGPTLAATRRLLSDGVRRAKALPETMATRWIMPDALRDADPQLRSVVNCNTREDWDRVRQMAEER